MFVSIVSSQVSSAMNTMITATEVPYTVAFAFCHHSRYPGHKGSAMIMMIVPDQLHCVRHVTGIRMAGTKG
jgi:hypothetical protein